MDWKHHMPATSAIEIHPGRPSKHEASPTALSSSFLPELKRVKVGEDDVNDDGSTGALILSSRSASSPKIPGEVGSEADDADAVERQILGEKESARLRRVELWRQRIDETYRHRPVLINGREYLLATKPKSSDDFPFSRLYCYLLDANPRPISEPPIFDYNWMTKEKGWIEEEEEWHDMKYGDEVSFKTQRIDLVIEKEVVEGYRDWISEAASALFMYPASRSTSDSDAASRHRFLDCLQDNLNLDFEEIRLELYDLEGTREANPGMEVPARHPFVRERFVNRVAWRKSTLENVDG